MTPIESMLSKVEWEVTDAKPSTTDSDLPHATHKGVLDLFGHSLRCYRLNTGEAVFDADDFKKFWEGML